MAKHEFGIMQTEPIIGQRFDTYEPHKYNCISVDDNYIELILEKTLDINFYWHSIDVAGKGLEYCGITLIPPTSLAQLISLLDDEHFRELKKLLEQAIRENKFVIHFGL